MRTIMMALAFSLAAAAPAAGEAWVSPDSKMAFDTPDGWTVTPQPIEGVTYLLASDTEARECHFVSADHPETQVTPPDLIRRAGLAPIAPESWNAIVQNLPEVFDGEATLISQTIETEQFWPLQRADFNSHGRVVHAGIQFRPGLELWAFCLSRTGADDPAAYQTILRSVSVPTDAQLQASAERMERERRRAANMQARPQSDMVRGVQEAAGDQAAREFQANR